MPEALAKKLRAAGVVFYDWGVSDDGTVLGRLMLSFATPDEHVDRLIALAAGQ
jgi:threonine aldolase